MELRGFGTAVCRSRPGGSGDKATRDCTIRGTSKRSLNQHVLAEDFFFFLFPSYSCFQDKLKIENDGSAAWAVEGARSLCNVIR